MFALSRSARSLIVSILVSYSAAGCSLFKGEEKVPGASAADEVGRPLNDMDLPVSLRMRDPQPTDAHQIEVTTEQLRLGGVPVIALANGKVADADKTPDGIIPKLETALRGASHAGIALRIQANLSYGTVALILNTAKKAGVMNASFAVREVGNSSKTGWLTADGYVMISRAEYVPPIPSVAPKPWEAFTAKWEEITAACKSAPTGNCAYADTNFARGGSLKIELLSSGRGVNVDFYQVGLTQQQQKDEEKRRAKDLAKKKEDFLQGRISNEDMVAFLLLGDPATQALFQFRYQEALSAPSSLTSTMAPMCHHERCGVVVTADPVSPMVRVVTMMGAAFPDGTPSPAYAFEQPWTKKHPGNLPQWADDVLAKDAEKQPPAPTQ